MGVIENLDLGCCLLRTQLALKLRTGPGLFAAYGLSVLAMVFPVDEL